MKVHRRIQNTNTITPTFFQNLPFSDIHTSFEQTKITEKAQRWPNCQSNFATLFTCVQNTGLEFTVSHSLCVQIPLVGTDSQKKEKKINKNKFCQLFQQAHLIYTLAECAELICMRSNEKTIAQVTKCRILTRDSSDLIASCGCGVNQLGRNLSFISNLHWFISWLQIFQSFCLHFSFNHFPFFPFQLALSMKRLEITVI